ncbi:hypothetical protein ASD44_00420 [Mesorhizobium sp. Root554]|uniref:hypothetical protein n=1 Tax=unclassified Mesorhizobium TaxID=325217 RepID=UPI000700627A|nr:MULTISPECIES: hypothetical protein [unclassified Mesorhizobium]KQZ12689.1 hypothetical protein ASD27_00420 [Mesorhizobium sp. Root1471]KQZ35211.1 hypothetical protein ASD44_00420 [Mesorhizobium sp. Root554]
MKVLGAIVAAAAVYGGAHILKLEADAPPSRPASVAGAYRLVANGGQACTVERRQTSSAISALNVDPGCGELLPGLERAKFWRDNDDGTVSFSQNGVDPIVVFAAADGEGYESYQPALPLLSMAASQ